MTIACVLFAIALPARCTSLHQTGAIPLLQGARFGAVSVTPARVYAIYAAPHVGRGSETTALTLRLLAIDPQTGKVVGSRWLARLPADVGSGLCCSAAQLQIATHQSQLVVFVNLQMPAYTHLFAIRPDTLATLQDVDVGKLIGARWIPYSLIGFTAAGAVRLGTPLGAGGSLRILDLNPGAAGYAPQRYTIRPTSPTAGCGASTIADCAAVSTAGQAWIERPGAIDAYDIATGAVTASLPNKTPAGLFAIGATLFAVTGPNVQKGGNSSLAIAKFGPHGVADNKQFKNCQLMSPIAHGSGLVAFDIFCYSSYIEPTDRSGVRSVNLLLHHADREVLTTGGFRQLADQSLNVAVVGNTAETDEVPHVCGIGGDAKTIVAVALAPPAAGAAAPSLQIFQGSR